MKSNFSINVVLLVLLILPLIYITFINISSYCSSGIFKVNLFNGAKYGGLSTTLCFLIILTTAYFSERRKLISLKITEEKVVVKGLFFRKDFDRSKIQVEEKTIAPNLSRKNFVLILNSKYVISEFYIKNYKEMREALINQKY